MTESDLKSFATYSFDQESRGIIHNDFERHSHISKFGVGAKEAGFFLGDSFRVITKSKQSSVCEMLMDEAEYERRFKTNCSVYEGQIHKFDNVDMLLKAEILSNEELLNENLKDLLIKTAAAAEDQYTVIIIRIRPQECVKLVQRYLEIFNELALIYHFYLHPEHDVNTVIKEDKYQKP